MREYIECIRTLWTATPTTPVSYAGEFYQVQNYIRFLPAMHTSVPIYLAGVNPRMIQLAGSHADGLILGPLNSAQCLIPGMLSAVTDSMVDTLILAGTPDDVHRQVQAYARLLDTMLLYCPYFTVGLEETLANHAAMIETLRA